jgi:site-specific recombinase XerD
MLDTLYSLPAVLARHRAAPLAAERERFLRYCAARGHKQTALRKISWLLLVVVTSVPLDKKMVRLSTIQRTAREHNVRFMRRRRHRRCTTTQQLFIRTATKFFSFLERLAPAVVRSHPLAPRIAVYRQFMLEERGLSAATVEARCQHVDHFLTSLCRRRSLRRIAPHQIDRYLVSQSRNGWSRPSMAALTSSLRCFFRFAEAQRWCRLGMAAAIDSPRMYAHEGVPDGPTWDQVQRLIANTAGDRPEQVRDLAIVLLLAIYGLRRGEVAGLRLQDIDWQTETIRVFRSKQRRVQHFPLVRPVGDAIVRYLRKVRPQCAHRELFLALKPPVRPLSASSISAVVRWRLRAIGVTLPRVGAHSLRHACARHLLARGFSLKQIGDQLGHRRASTTLHYAKIDLDGLRQVADLDLRRVL